LLGSFLLNYVYRSAKFDAKFFNFFARLFILFYSHQIPQMDKRSFILVRYETMLVLSY